MPLTVIHGKPRSGKTCYCVSLLIKIFEDWARYQVEKGVPYPRKIYTNIPLFVDEINDYLSEKIGVEVDLSGRITILESDFFRDENGDYREWWQDFDVGALIVIDEVHHYLPASIKRQKGGQKLADRFMEYVSMHGHSQQDLIFLTQHVNNVTTEVRKQIEAIYEVLNIKNQIWGIWPFTIPLADIDVVRESWGMAAQFAHVKRGICQAGRAEYGKSCEVFLLHNGLFKLYRSHTNSNEALDRPSLKLGRFGSLTWFARRHFIRLGTWALVVFTAVWIAYNVATSIPGVLTSSLKPKNLRTSQIGTEPTSTVTLPNGDIRLPVPVQMGDDEIIGFVKGGVITPRGVLRKNDHLIYEGEKDFVQSVDVMKGTLYLGSGKKVQK